MIEAKETQVGPRSIKVWFAYVDGKMLRDNRGVGRRFKTKEAALAAAVPALLSDKSLSVTERESAAHRFFKVGAMNRGMAEVDAGKFAAKEVRRAWASISTNDPSPISAELAV